VLGYEWVVVERFVVSGSSGAEQCVVLEVGVRERV
jgi:hypothetical protein